jgi:hypothetical protein
MAAAEEQTNMEIGIFTGMPAKGKGNPLDPLEIEIDVRLDELANVIYGKPFSACEGVKQNIKKDLKNKIKIQIFLPLKDLDDCHTMNRKLQQKWDQLCSMCNHASSSGISVTLTSSLIRKTNFKLTEISEYATKHEPQSNGIQSLA